MPLDAPVTIATLLDSLLVFTIVLFRLPVPRNVHHCELRLARMKISIYAPYAKERFETARQHSILHPERMVGNTEAIPSSLRVSFDSLNERTAVAKSFKMRGVY